METLNTCMTLTDAINLLCIMQYNYYCAFVIMKIDKIRPLYIHYVTRSLFIYIDLVGLIYVGQQAGLCMRTHDQQAVHVQVQRSTLHMCTVSPRYFFSSFVAPLSGCHRESCYTLSHFLNLNAVSICTLVCVWVGGCACGVMGSHRVMQSICTYRLLPVTSCSTYTSLVLRTKF